MHVPQWFKPAFWGVVVGTIGIMIIGFAWWGWVLGSTAEKMAKERADGAVTASLSPSAWRDSWGRPTRLRSSQNSSEPLHGSKVN